MTNDRKIDHIKLAFKSQSILSENDQRFIYEPLLSAHPLVETDNFHFEGKLMKFPLWISSMTGGTGMAQKINENLARACGEFGLGMGLGSCRKLLFDHTSWDDFNWRDTIGNDYPFYANLGIAQVEQILSSNQEKAIEDMIGNLRADGLIIHVNPLQEWLQPEGDRLKQAPIDTIKQLLDKCDIRIIVKEVGQGMGPESLKRLLQLPLVAIELAAFGGTNFSKLELSRVDPETADLFAPVVRVGQSIAQMIKNINSFPDDDIVCKNLIISGGIQNSLDGYFYSGISKLPSVFGMAATLLPYAEAGYPALKNFIEKQIEMYHLAKAYFRINPEFR